MATNIQGWLLPPRVIWFFSGELTSAGNVDISVGFDLLVGGTLTDPVLV